MILLLLLPLALAGTGIYLACQHGESTSEKSKSTAPDVSPDLRAALEEIDRADPSWRFDELNARRAEIPADENMARRVETAAEALPRDWPKQSLADELNRLGPTTSLTAKLNGDLIEEMTMAAPALAEARKLGDEGKGRFNVVWRLDYLSTDMSHLKCTQAVEQLMSLECLRASEAGDAGAALAAARGVLNAGRSLGDEPMLQSCLTRMESHALATKLIERVLAQGQPDEEALAATQRLLEDEAGENLLLIGARAERAGLHGLLLALEDNQLRTDDLSPPDDLARQTLHEKLLRVLQDRDMNKLGTFEQAHAWVLLYLTEFVEIAKAPVEQQRARLGKLLSRRSKAPPAARLLLPRVDDMAQTAQKSQAFLRAAATALAVERFRRAKGQWPEKLTDLVPAYLAALPMDPFDGRPLRFNKPNEGAVIYSVGADGQDDGGRFETLNTYHRGTDLGFRLWDVDKRRQTSEP
jgi:hypothetical protein